MRVRSSLHKNESKFAQSQDESSLYEYKLCIPVYMRRVELPLSSQNKDRCRMPIEYESFESEVSLVAEVRKNGFHKIGRVT